MNLNDISTQIIFTTVPIYVEKNDGTNSSGTGFIYQHKIDENKSIPFIITNKHIVENAKRGIVNFIKRQGTEPKLTEKISVELPGQLLSQYISNTDDIAVFLIGPIINELESKNIQIFFRSIEQSIIPNEEILNNLSAIEEITFIGYPSGIVDNKNNTPIVRKGITATPVWNDFNGQNIFLIDAGVFPGSSGSPVFILNSGAYTTNQGIVVGNRIYFLGIISATIQRQEIGGQVYLGLGHVIKGRIIRNFVESIASKLNK